MRAICHVFALVVAQCRADSMGKTAQMTDQTDAPLVAHLLYPKDAGLPDLAGFAARLNDALARVQLSLQDMGQDDAGAHVFAHPLVSLRLRMVDIPCPVPALAAALNAPFMAVKPGDLPDQVARHAWYMELTVTTTATQDDDGTLPWPMQLVVLHRALLILIDADADVVVHMPLSDMLFTRSEVLATSEMTLPIALCLHPLPIASAQVPTIAGILPPLGLILIGAERFCDKTVMLVPSTLPLHDGLTLLTSLLRDHVGGVFRLDDGAHLRHPTHDGIFIRHGGPDGRILIGLGDWPDPDAPPPRVVDLSELTPRPRRPVTHESGLMAQIASRIGRFALSPNGLITIAGIAAYLLISHLAGQWFESQSEMIRAAVGPRN